SFPSPRLLRENAAVLLIKVLLYTSALLLLRIQTPMSLFTKVLPTTVTCSDISKKKPAMPPQILSAGSSIFVRPTFSTLLLIKIPSLLPTSYHRPFENGLSVIRFSRHTTL